MGDLKAVLEPLLTHPPSPPPLGDIAGRARRRKARRFRVAAAAVVVGLGGVVTGVARLAVSVIGEAFYCPASAFSSIPTRRSMR